MPCRKLAVNGLNIHIEEQGEGPVVLFAHGFPETSYAWRHQVAALAAAGFHAVAPDMRGYGETDSPAEVTRYSTFDLVGDLVGLLDALSCENAIIVGNDWGSTVAWQATLLRPDRFKGVVAIGVPMMDAPPAPPTTFFPQTDDELFYTLYFREPGVAEAELDRNVDATLRRFCSPPRVRLDLEEKATVPQTRSTWCHGIPGCSQHCRLPTYYRAG